MQSPSCTSFIMVFTCGCRLFVDGPYSSSARLLLFLFGSTAVCKYLGKTGCGSNLWAPHIACSSSSSYLLSTYTFGDPKSIYLARRRILSSRRKRPTYSSGATTQRQGRVYAKENNMCTHGSSVNYGLPFLQLKRCNRMTCTPQTPELTCTRKY